MSKPIVQAVFALVLCGCSGLCQAADVSFVQPAQPDSEGILSELPTDQNADNFSFAGKTKLKTVRWWGTYISSTPEPDAVTLRLFNGGTTAPNMVYSNQITNLTVSRTDSGLLDAFGDTIFQYEAQIPTTVVFSAGSTAYISVLNQTSGGWFWQKSNNTGSNWFRFDDEDTWVEATDSTVGNFAFELIGVTPPPGDYNEDFVVNQSDYAVWRRKFGTSDAVADGNGDGVVNAADYVVWRKNIVMMAAASTTAFAVPEPSTIGLLFGAIFIACGRRVTRQPVRLYAASLAADCLDSGGGAI